MTDQRDVLKALAQVRLHGFGVFGLWQNLQQLIVWQEVKPDRKH